MEAIGLRWCWPLEASAWIIDADHPFFGEQEHAREMLQPISFRVRAACDLIHQRFDVDRLQAVERLVAVVGAEALKHPAAAFLCIQR